MALFISQTLAVCLLAICFSCTRPSKKALAAKPATDAKEGAVFQSASSTAPPKVFMLPAGTRFSVRIPNGVSSQKNPAGSNVEGELAAPISAFAETIAARGAKVMTVVGGSPDDGITLRATRIDLKGGRSYYIASDEPQFRAQVIPAEALVGFRLRNPVQVTVD